MRPTRSQAAAGAEDVLTEPTSAVCKPVVLREQEVKMANLYVFHEGQDIDQQLWYTIFDGTNWARDTRVQNVGMSGSPSAVPWAGGITVFHQGQMNDGQLWYTYSPDGANWELDTQVKNVGMTASPSAVVF